ncbi:MAG: 30S ribosomal protein S18 [Candidatus Absconditabacteria bacterium]|nr:30S ribosomal protein S18 [Candidatus Absconditabacteria bacterium]MDD3868195.1 30S ribosomal protein S18 [Candidatus Absconditabacteria bacterium]MDD4714582.1 30S ribosomal protein S18 [Candidatus Absconditabacteria bacterium]
MKSYELVLMLNVSASEAERKAFLTDIESKFKVIDKDEIGVKEICFELKGRVSKAYLVSYQVELSSEDIVALKQALLYSAILIRYEIFLRTANQPFFHFDALQKEFEKAIEDIKDKRYGQKVNFFTKEENAKYLNWKSVAILKYYLTRFGNIKPREYTGNNVKTQKKLRAEIIRARTLGVLPFINH